MSDKHTPTPWFVYHETLAGPISEIYDGTLVKMDDGYHIPHGTNLIAQVANVGSWESTKANGELIIKACNNYEKLLSSCRDALLTIEHLAETDCECDNTHEQNDTVCRMCELRRVIEEAK